jgi:hypothetical protein
MHAPLSRGLLGRNAERPESPDINQAFSSIFKPREIKKTTKMYFKGVHARITIGMADRTNNLRLLRGMQVSLVWGNIHGPICPAPHKQLLCLLSAQLFACSKRFSIEHVFKAYWLTYIRWT